MSLKSLRDVLQTCAFCPKLCRFACPVAEAEGRESVTPWGLLTLADDVRRGLAELSAPLAELWTHCTGCGACTAQCKHGNPVADAVYGLRALAVEADLAPAELLKWSEQSVPSSPCDELPNRGRALVLPGTLDANHVDEWLTILGALGVDDLFSLGDMPTAGGRLLAGGRRDAFETYQRAAGENLSGAECIICLDPDDYAVLNSHWRTSLGEDVRIRHALEVVGDRVDALTPVHDGDLVLVDSCRLARDPALAAMARVVVRAMTRGSLVETLLHAGEAGCCGAGGGYGALHPPLAAKVARESVEGTGDCDIVALGTCAGHLANSVPGRSVHRLSGLVSRSLKEERTKNE